MSESSSVDPLQRGPKLRKTTGFGADFMHPVLADYAAEAQQEPRDISFYMPEGPHSYPEYPEYKEGSQETEESDISNYLPEGPHVFKDPEEAGDTIVVDLPEGDPLLWY